ncbi:lipin 1 [Pseudohyphozyma bogoriensis]|nr:lipin 1 [Pseudohyphozyma bogoriensis]
MQWVRTAVQYYKDINPATLTGAIDVIVVERPGDDGQVELACSPFHVRFGKLSVLRPIDKKVRITVNEESVPFYMKVGETGEAFFVFETDADVPEDLQTSPLARPVPDGGEGEPGAEGAVGEPEFLDLDASEADAHRHDEDHPYDSPGSSPTTSRYHSMNPTLLNSPTETIRQLPPMLDRFPNNLTSVNSEDEGDDRSESVGEADEDASQRVEEEDGDGKDSKVSAKAKAASFVPSALMLGTEKAAGLGKAVLTGLGSSVGGNAKLKNVVKDGRRGTAGGGASKDDEEMGEPEAAKSETGNADDEVTEGLQGFSLDETRNHRDRKEDVGDEVRRAARRANSDVMEVLGGPEGLGSPEGVEGPIVTGSGFSMTKATTGAHEEVNDVFGNISPPSDVGGAPDKLGDLMLDMSGYKIESEEQTDKSQDAAKRLLAETHPSVQLNAPMDDRAEEEMIAFTQGLLQSTDPKTLRGFFDPADSEAESSRAASPTPLSLDDDISVDSSIPSPRSKSPIPAETISELQSLASESEARPPSPTDGVFHASPKQFSLRVSGRLHVFELSLCGNEDFGHDRTRDEHAFVEHQVTFSQFMEHDDITEHENLVVKYAGRYLTWDNASPVLASLAVYRKSLVDHPEHHRHVDVGRDGVEEHVEPGKRASRWGLWWGRKADSTISLPTQDTSPPVSPPISRPASPRSLPLPTSPEPISPLVEPVSTNLEPDKRHYAKTLRLTSDQLKELNLKKGMNVITFSVRSSYSGYATCSSRIFLWESDFQVVISDIDGTITKSDALGHVFTMIGRDWTHLGVAKLYTDISRNGYKMMYLTSRAIGQADTTREYLKGIKQNGFQLPEGPVIMSPDRLMTSLHREVIMRKPEVFKMACLRDIQRLFSERSPFYAGFGNRITDALSYRSVDIPSSRIFTIDTNGEVKMELLELAGYKSSYIHMHDLVDQMFPPINRKTAPDYTDFNFWRAPVMQFDIPDLAPPSPALSARSDSSRLGFPRLGSLASSLSRRSSRATLSEAPPRSTRAGTPSSPLLQASVAEEPFDLDDLEDERSESGSMPGSLPQSGDFERYRAAARARNLSEAEAYKHAVTTGHADEEDEGEDHGEEGEEEEEEEYGEEDQDEEFGDQLDFSSVPYL